MKNPLLHFLSSKSLASFILIIICCLLVFVNIRLASIDSDPLAPHNILVSILPSGERDFVLEEENLSTQDEKEPQSAFLEQPVLAPTLQKETLPESSFSGDISEKPLALLKPLLPIASQQQRVEDSQQIRTYTVKTGDTLGGIAATFGIKLTTLLWANDLRATSFLKPGRSLTILPTDGISYRIRRGDTLGGIAKKFNVDSSKISSFNALPNEHSLAVGQLLIIPGGQPLSQAPSQPRTLVARLRNVLAPQRIISGSLGGITRMIWPTSARIITQYFNWRHVGVDIAGPVTNKIYASAAGRVVRAGWYGGYGRSVDIDHGNGYRTRYGHASKLFVQAGDVVEQGEVIAMVGSTGYSTGPHLHFEIFKNGKRVNPLQLIR